MGDGKNISLAGMRVKRSLISGNIPSQEENDTTEEYGPVFRTSVSSVVSIYFDVGAILSDLASDFGCFAMIRSLILS